MRVLRRWQIDDELTLGRKFDRQISGFFALQNAVHVASQPANLASATHTIQIGYAATYAQYDASLAFPLGAAGRSPEALGVTVMNNYGLATADRLTHVKIVAVALITCVAIVSAGKAARQELSDTNARVEARTQIIAADKSALWTGASRIIR